ncbi:MAG: hypothetical protein JST39_09925, partial [Bacteroidetes bacterium]|nr:hypothetical protein [Bacteroidota bacterium]
MKRLLFIPVLFSVCLLAAQPPKDYPIRPVPFTQVHITDNFWAPKLRVNAEVTIP